MLCRDCVRHTQLRFGYGAGVGENDRNATNLGFDDEKDHASYQRLGAKRILTSA